MLRPDLPRPFHRLGPRPLWLHLTPQALSNPANSSPDWLSGWQSWSGSLPNGILQQSGQQSGPDAALLAGIAAYRRHPWFRDLPDPPPIWQEGSSRLLDYGPADGIKLLVVPSLVNRATVLDLLPGHSMLRYLAGQGIRPLLLDWGCPEATERAFSLSDYIAGRLERALAEVARAGPVAVAGYCMGGLMTVASAQRRPDLISSLALLATPWNFAASGPGPADAVGRMLPALEPILGLGGTLPVDALQILFSLLDPGSVAAKYRQFGRQDQSGVRATMFVAVEDWLNDGVPLAAPVARECLAGWYGANTPARGEWRILGLPIRPQTLTLPSFIAIPRRDRIVPPESARALAEAIPGAVVHTPAAGHVGMVAGSTARTVLWEPLINWLKGKQ